MDTSNVPVFDIIDKKMKQLENSTEEAYSAEPGILLDM